MLLLDYENGIHPESCQHYRVVNDIIITPFWTKEFCDQLVSVADFYSDYFKNNIDFLYEKNSSQTLGWEDLKIELISPIFFRQYTEHYKKGIIPLLEKVYSKESAFVSGWFSPYIIRYDKINQKASLHNDTSHFTLNIKLNDNYKGCELYFPRQNFSNKDIPVGYAVIWPSTVTHPHLATPLEEGIKYSFISWTWPLAWQPNGLQNI